METLRIFCDHLCFSVICAGVEAIALYAILYGIGADSAISNHLLAIGIACGALCAGLALLLTHRNIKGRAQQPIVYTQRQY